jgi:hypothetical protein
MLLARSLLLSLVLLAPLACSGPNAGANVANAAIGTGLAVAAAGINRAVSKECWAACRPGLVCDHASGLCVEAGSVQSGGPRSHPLEPINANAAGREYEVPALGADGGDAGASADARDDEGAR